MLPDNIETPEDSAEKLAWLIEDTWARMFGLSLGTDCPTERAKHLFINYVSKEYKRQPPENDEEFIYSLLPKFINYLVDRG